MVSWNISSISITRRLHAIEAMTARVDLPVPGIPRSNMDASALNTRRLKPSWPGPGVARGVERALEVADAVVRQYVADQTVSSLSLVPLVSGFRLWWDSLALNVAVSCDPKLLSSWRKKSLPSPLSSPKDAKTRFVPTATEPMVTALSIRYTILSYGGDRSLEYGYRPSWRLFTSLLVLLKMEDYVCRLRR